MNQITHQVTAEDYFKAKLDFDMSPYGLHKALLPGKLKTLPKNKTIVTYCGSITCQLAPTAALELAQKGFKVKELHGGIKEWTGMGFPVEK